MSKDIKLYLETPLTKEMSKVDLYLNTHIHKRNVRGVINYMIERLEQIQNTHDETKFLNGTYQEVIDDDFYSMLINKEKNGWWKMHQETERHHLTKPEFVQDDVNLFDVLECIADWVSAGYGRLGHFEQGASLSGRLLHTAFNNTLSLINDMIKLEEK